jgi:hypothetical protein
LLFLSQGAAFWIVRQTGAGQPLPQSVDPSLIQLAHDINSEWASMLQQMPRSPVELPENRGQSLLERESLLLQLTDMEAALQTASAELGLGAELQGWVQARGEGVDPDSLSRFILALTGWLRAFGEPPPGLNLKRLALHPDTGGRFPSLSFELRGEPIAMGEGLLRVEGFADCWSLDELDLVRDPGLPGWWMRGSLTFNEEMLPE